MSFSKAKIHRFNENKECTPSPAKYNLLNQDKIKYGTIGKCSKKTGSPPPSETGSIRSTPCFQTPTAIPKKKKLLGLSFRSSKNHDTEELREKIVECNNKDMYIKDLTDQIEEMTVKINSLNNEKEALHNENDKWQGKLATLQAHYTKEYTGVDTKVKELNKEMNIIRGFCKSLKSESVADFEKLFLALGKFQTFFVETAKQNREREEQLQNEILKLKEDHKTEIDELLNKLEESEARAKLLEENFKELNLLTEMQMKERVEEIEGIWTARLEEKEKESEAILKECQAISEYNIIQSEIEKNRYKSQYEEMADKCGKLEEEMIYLKTEKHAYELSINTFKDTIEVLKKRLIDSDRDVIQLKEEVEACEEKIIYYEKKSTEITNQLNETQTANEELEMQYESTSKIMQDQVENMKQILLEKVEALSRESKQISKDRELLNHVMEQHREQQDLITRAQDTISQSAILIQTFETKQIQLETRLTAEIEDAAEIRKKYIEKTGKYDELAHQFEQLLQELDQSKSRVQELETLMVSCQEQLEKYKIEKEEVSEKYAEILGHQNHKQKLKHMNAWKMKSSELFEKNMTLESENYKLIKTMEKLRMELDSLKKPSMKREDKENIASPKYLKGVQSPGPLKERN